MRIRYFEIRTWNSNAHAKIDQIYEIYCFPKSKPPFFCHVQKSWRVQFFCVNSIHIIGSFKRYLNIIIVKSFISSSEVYQYILDFMLNNIVNIFYFNLINSYRHKIDKSIIFSDKSLNLLADYRKEKKLAHIKAENA